MQNNDDVIEIDLKEVFGLIIHWLWLILLCGLLTGAIGFAISEFVITPQYASTTKVYILNRQNSDSLTYSDLQMGSQLTKDYAQLIRSRDVLESVIETAGLDESYASFSSRVTVETLTDTRIIAITVEDASPAMAQYLADEIRTVAAEHIKNVMDIQAVNVAEMANLPSAPSSPSVKKWTAVGFLLGAFLSTMIIVLQFLVDDTIKTSDDVERYLGLSTLAMIPMKEDESKKKKRRSSSHSSGSSSSGTGNSVSESISYEFNTDGREVK
jgi:capsular polysaccharide biosynthesis protein